MPRTSFAAHKECNAARIRHWHGAMESSGSPLSNIRVDRPVPRAPAPTGTETGTVARNYRRFQRFSPTFCGAGPGRIRATPTRSRESMAWHHSCLAFANIGTPPAVAALRCMQRPWQALTERSHAATDLRFACVSETFPASHGLLVASPHRYKRARYRLPQEALLAPLDGARNSATDSGTWHRTHETPP